MTKEQVEKHSRVIKWFCDNPEKGVWGKLHSPEEWTLIFKPNFSETEVFIQNDEHAELRKLLADGEEIVYKSGSWAEDASARWVDCKISPTSMGFWWSEWKLKKNILLREVKEGEYAEDTTFKVGDWVLSSSGKLSKIVEYTDRSVVLHNVEGYQHKDCFLKNNYKLWAPQEGDVVVYWDDNSLEMNIGKVTICKGALAVPHADDLTELHYFDNIIPYIGQPFNEMK